jgi:hypothetical protein
VVDPALQELAEEPLGSFRLQEIADEAHRRLASRGIKPPPEVVAMAKRVSKIHLPAGRRLPKDERPAREEFASRQIDLEEAVEAAGGQCGSVQS